MSKYREAAEKAQQNMLGNIPENSATTTDQAVSAAQELAVTRNNPKITENTKDSMEIADTAELPNKSDLKAQQKQLKKLKKIEKHLLQTIQEIQDSNAKEETNTRKEERGEDSSLKKFNSTSLPELKQKLQEIQDRQNTLLALTQQNAIASVAKEHFSEGKSMKPEPNTTPKMISDLQVTADGTLLLPKDKTLADFQGSTLSWTSVKHSNGILTRYRPSYRDLFPQRVTLHDQFRTFHRLYGEIHAEEIAKEQKSAQAKSMMASNGSTKKGGKGGKYIPYHDQAKIVPDNTSTAYEILLPGIRTFEQSVDLVMQAELAEDNQKIAAPKQSTSIK
jgi:hypothetical protein